MKKIAIASAAMGGAALIAFGATGTFAAFSDSETVRNSAGAGTLVLDARTTSVTTSVPPMGLAPGESAKFAYWVQNDGNLNGLASATFTNVQGSENGCYGPVETAPGSGCVPDGTGQFADNATVTGHVLTSVDTAEACVVDAVSEPGTLSSSAHSFNAATQRSITEAELKAGQGGCVVLEVTLLAEATNEVQSDTVSFDVVITLDQDTASDVD